MELSLRSCSTRNGALQSQVHAVPHRRLSISPCSAGKRIARTPQAVMQEAAPAPGTSERKLWGGRFTGKTDPLMEKFNESLPFDKRMWAEDIQGSQAYAKALARVGILTAEEADTLVKGLSTVAAEWKAGEFVIKSGDEDIHTANERRLTELVGSVGGKLHTGRSRNDQVATDTRLWLYNQLLIIRGALHELMKVAADRAEAEVDVLMPGFTHLQPAMTVRWSHWMLCHASSWQRDDMRLRDLLPRVATLPLGSGALAGNPFLVDRQFIAKELGMVGGVCPNSMDAVSDRDFVLESVFFAAVLMTHLSRWAEDLIIYSSGQFGFVQCSDAYATGSSLMPQKKNPDALELIRGKAGRLQGNLAGVMAIVKGTPTTYNKDFQECWEFMYDTVDTTYDCATTSVHLNCRTHATDEDCDAHMQDAEDAASPRFLLHSPTTSDEERATAAGQLGQAQAGDGVASSAMAGSDREVTRSTALHLHLHPHHQLHDHHLHNLQLHHHHHGHLNLATQSPDGGVSDESGDESDRATADASSGSDNDDDADADARHHRGDDDDNDRHVDDDSDNDDDDDVDEADGRLHHRRHNTAAAAVASSAVSSSSGRDSPSLLPLPPPTTTTSTSTSTSSSSGQHYGASMCYGTTPLRLMGPRFADVPPWLRDSERKDDLPSLHEEILSFCKWVSPSAEEKQMREDVIARISKVVETLWPSVQLRVFGSCATDIYLPTSDIDLCIMGANACSPSPIDELASALRRRSMGRVQAIATARVPIIKLVDAATGCLVDISFDVPTGPAHINLIKRYLDEEPAVKPLALLIKYYLKQFGMNEPYTGGLGSYALIIMIISYLQLHKPRAVEKQQDLGVLFLGFLKLYGQEFNYFRTGLSIRDGGYYFPKAQRNWVDWQQPWLLSAEDPCFPENDISRMSYAIMDVRGCLANAYKVLISKEPSYSAPSLLCRILLQDEKMMEQRDFVRHHYRCGLPILPHLATAPASSAHAAGHRPPPAVSWRSDKSSKSRPPATTTYAAKSASASSIDSVVVERRAAPALATQQPQQAKAQQPRTGDWVSLVMKNAGSNNGPAGPRASKGGKPQHGSSRAHGDSASSREGDDKEDLTWRRNPPGTKPASSSSSRSSNSSSSSRSSATAARRSGSGRWERSSSSSSSSSNCDRRDRRVAQPASSSSSASSSTAASRGRGAVRQKGASGGADVSTSKRTSDEAATVPRRRASMRRPNPASSTASTAPAAPPAATASLEPRKRSRAADSPMEAIINNILIANQHHNNSNHTSSAALATPNLIGVGSNNGDHEGANANGQRTKARNQKQKR